MMYKTEDVGSRCSTAVKRYGPEVRLPRYKSLLQLLLSRVLRHLASIYLSFYICEVGLIMGLHGTAVRIKLNITDVKHLAQYLVHK